MADVEEKSFWDRLHDQLIDKLNEMLRDDEFKAELEYFFEPVTESTHEEIFTLTNPFKNQSFKFSWPFSKTEEDVPIKPQLLDEDVDTKSLQELLNILNHIEYKTATQANRSEKGTVKKKKSKEFPFIDFYETDSKYIVSIEVPRKPEHEVDIRASPHELEITVGDEFHKLIHIKPRVNPDTAIASYDGKGLVEVKFTKINKKPKAKIKVRRKIN